jgi:hypothetical protein
LLVIPEAKSISKQNEDVRTSLQMKVLPSILECKKLFQNCLDRRNAINTLCDINHLTPHYHKSGGIISNLALISHRIM